MLDSNTAYYLMLDSCPHELEHKNLLTVVLQATFTTHLSMVVECPKRSCIRFTKSFASDSYNETRNSNPHFQSRRIEKERRMKLKSKEE